MSANEKAEAIILVIKRIFKWVAKAIGILILMGIAIYYFSELSSWYTKGRHEAKVKVEVKFDTTNCSKEMPLSVQIINGSTKTIERMSLYVDVNYSGRSSKINDWHSLDMDYIIPPSKTASLCWGVLSKDDSKVLSGQNMTVFVDHYYTTFKEEK